MPKITQRPTPTRTFLEHVCQRLLGPPIRKGGSPGESFWHCPACNHERFHTMPHHADMKDRFRCWRCPFRGDEADLHQFFYPHEGWPTRRDILSKWREEW